MEMKKIKNDSKVKKSPFGRSTGKLEKLTEEIAFMRAVAESLRDIEKGKVLSASETKAKLGLKTRQNDLEPLRALRGKLSMEDDWEKLRALEIQE